MQTSVLIFRNRIALFQWVFAALWVAMLGAMTWLLATQGPPPGYSMVSTAAIMLAFWMAGAGLIAYVGRKSCTTVAVGPGEAVACTRRYPFRVERWKLSCKSISRAELVESVDDESDPYFYSRIKAAGGLMFDLAESHSREYCEAVCERFNQAAHK